MSQFDSSLSSEFAKYLRSPAARCRRSIGGCLCVSSFLCSPLFASLPLPRPVQLALLRQRLRHRSPAPPTSSGSRRYFVRSWRATARPPVSGSAVGSSATLIASNVIVLSAGPFGSQSPPLGKPWEGIVFVYGSGPIWVPSWPLLLPGSSPGGGSGSAAKGVIGDNCFAAALMAAPVSCAASRSASSQWAAGGWRRSFSPGGRQVLIPFAKPMGTVQYFKRSKRPND